MVVRDDLALADVASEERSAGLADDVWKLAFPLAGGIDFEEAYSTSGNEANNLFYNLGGRDFVDVSLVSGFDLREDGRSVARLDLDRDGFVDLAVTNANAPRLQLLRNRIGETAAGSKRNFLAIRLVGGNDSATPSAEWSARDACGARVEVTAGGRTRALEQRCGEGFAAQNSSTLILGLGEATEVEALRVLWPSGRVTAADRPAEIAPRSTLTLRERE